MLLLLFLQTCSLTLILSAVCLYFVILNPDQSLLLGSSVKLVAWVNALHNLSHKKSWEIAASLLGQFLSRCCFMLCITVEVDPRITKQDKCHLCCSCKNYQGKGMEGWKKVSLHHFLADQKIVSSWKKCILRHPTAQATSCLTHSNYGPPKCP